MMLAISATSAQECFDDGNEFCIDKNDLLSADLLPDSFLFSDRAIDNASKAEDEIVDGSFDKALNEMDYHR